MASKHQSFGQKLEVSVALKRLIRDYPGDVGIFKELIQNADDGGAREIRLIFDPGTQSGLPAPLPGMDCLGGPAILAANDRPFEETDLQNIQQLANSEKIEAAGKTGRFGLGFNSVYNVTDFPLLLTGEHLCLFDPCSAIVGLGESGAQWTLNNSSFRSEYASFLELFTPAGYSPTNRAHPGSIFRLPLRSAAHTQLTGGKISDIIFQPTQFDQLVAGLGEIADSILLFLKHLEFIGCYRLDPATRCCLPLLEIETVNPGVVSLGRAPINDVLRGSVDEALTRIASSSPEGIGSSFLHEVCIRRPSEPERLLRWRVTAGLFPGKQGRLTTHARALQRYHEKAIPSSGVAVCLARQDEAFPPIEGQVCCFLPLGLKAGTYRVQIHGAFDIDSSRSDLTPHTPGEDERKRLRGQWNELLVEDGLAVAYCHALEQVKAHDLESLSAEVGAQSLYSLFPRISASAGGPMAQLATAVYAGIAARSLFRCADGSWDLPSNLRQLPPGTEPNLENCLATEGFRLPIPRLPELALIGLGSSAPQLLRSADLRQHFQMETDLALPLSEVPFPGLRVRGQLESLVRFLAGDPGFRDWSGMPLALCQDGKLHTYGRSDPAEKFLGTARQRRIFLRFPEWFLDEPFAEACGLAVHSGLGIARMSARRVAQLVNRVTKISVEGDDEYNEPCWNPKASEPPNGKWLIDVLTELNEAPADAQPDQNTIDAMCVIPGDDQRLHQPGDYETPLIVKSAQKHLCPMLTQLGVLHYKFASNDTLSTALEQFSIKYQRLWVLSPKDLAETLCKKAEWLADNQEKWTQRSVIDPVLQFLASLDGLETLRQHPDLLAELRELPLFEDQAGEFSSIGESSFLAGAFLPPRVPLPIRLLRESGWRSLLETLGVRKLDRQTLLRRQILPSYGACDATNQRQLLRWVRDEWNSILNECQDASARQALSEHLSETPLVFTTQGELAAIPQIYDPASRELIRSVLGDEAAFPDMAFYADQEDIWLSFFRSFDLAKTPRPQDLANFAGRLSERASDEGASAAVTRNAELLLAHLTEHWEQIHRETVEDAKGCDVTLAEYLRDLPWCPAVRELESLRYGAFTMPENRLFKPSELFLAEQGNLVASQAPLLKQSRAPSADMRLALEFQGSPEPAVVAAHLQELIRPFGTRILDETEHERVQRPARLILVYLGMFPQDNEESRAKLNAACAELCGLACVYHPDDRRFYSPGNLFQSAPSCLSPWKIGYKPGGGQKAQIAEALDLLGRREAPEIADYIEAMHSIAAQTPDGAALCENDARHFLQIQAALVVLAALLPDAPLDECPILDRQGFTTLPSEVLHLDDAWLELNMVSPTGLRLLHRDTPELLIERLGIQRVSRSLKKVPACAIETSRRIDFIARCKHLEQTVADQEFALGLRRIARKHYGLAGDEIMLPILVELQPIVFLRCNNQVELNGENHVLAETEEEFCVEETEPGLFQVWLAEAALEELPDRLARALNDCLPANHPLDTGIVAAILRCPLEKINGRLDRLRVPQLAQVSFSFLEESSGRSEVRFDESEDREMGAEPVRDLDVVDALPPETSAKDDEEWNEGDDHETEDGSLIDSRMEGDAGSTENEVKTAEHGNLSQHPTNGQRSHSLNWGARRARMLPKPRQEEATGGDSTRTPSSTRQQDDLWISRPKNQKQAALERQNGDVSDDEAPANDRIGKAAVGWALQYERSQGREPQNMAHANPGYDIESKRNSEIERYVEVKGINGTWGRNGVPLSSIQFEAAQELGEKFWLYVVENALDAKSVCIHTIQNPFAKTTQFRFDSGWIECGETVLFEALEPKEGRRIYIEDAGFGEIVRANLSGSTWHLQVKLSENVPVKSYVYNPLYMQLLAREKE